MWQNHKKFIVILNDERTKPLPELEAVRSQIESQLQEAAITAKIGELREATEVTLPEAGEFDPALLDAIDLLEPN